MRKFVIALAAAGSALAFASPATAQYYPQPQPYGQPYAYGHANDYGNPYFNSARALQARIDAVQHRIRYLGQYSRSAERLREESRKIERRLRTARYNGLNPYEANDIANRIARLESRVNYALARNGRGYGYANYNGANGYNNGAYYGNRDRDDDRDYDRDHDRDDDHRYDRADD